MTTKANNTTAANNTVVAEDSKIIMKNVFIENVNKNLKHRDEYITSQITARYIYEYFQDKDATADFIPTEIKCNKETGEPYAISMQMTNINKNATVHINNLKMFKTEEGDLINDVFALKENDEFPTLTVEGIKVSRMGASDKAAMKFPIRYYNLMNGGHEYNGKVNDYKGDWNILLKETELGELESGSEETGDDKYKLKDGMWAEVGRVVNSIYAGGLVADEYIGIDKIEALNDIVKNGTTKKAINEAEAKLDEIYDDGLTIIYPNMSYVLKDVRTK